MTCGEQVSVTVIIPVKNGADAIGEQLQALDDQRTDSRFEVLVCDNGSDDGTVAVVEAFRPRNYALRLVDAPGLPGAAHARNQGALHAQGALLLFCDADDRVDAGWVEAFLEAHSMWPYAVLSGRVILDEVNSPEILHALELGVGSGIADLAPEPATEGVFGYLPLVVGGCFGAPRDVYLRLRGMDESFLRVEDVEFGWRAQEAGIGIVNVPRAGVHYRMRLTPRSRFMQQYHASIANQLLYAHYRHTSMNGPSWRWALVTTGKSLVRLLAVKRNDPLRLRHAGRLGAALGLIRGMLRYRYRGRPPARALMSAVAD